MRHLSLSPDKRQTVKRSAVYLLVLIAFALRIYRIDYQSIWRDEGVSLHLAASSLSAILAERASNVHPPLYFILLRFWTRLAGFSELSARFFSLIFGVLLAPSLYFVTRKIFAERTALVTTAIAAVSPLFVVYSQETRMYAMLPLLYLFIIYKLYQLAQGERLKWRDWIGLAAFEVLTLYLHYFSMLTVAYANLFLVALWLKRGGINLRRWLSSQVLVALSCMPWAWIVVDCWMTEGPPRSYFGVFAPQSGIDLFEVASIVWHFSNGGYDLRGHCLFVALSSLLAGAFVTVLSLALRVDDQRCSTLITLCHWIVPLSMAFAVWWWKPMVSPRYVIMLTLPFFILAGRIIVVSIEAKGPTKLAGIFLATALVVTFALGLWIAYFDPGYSKDNVGGMVEYLERLSGADDVIIVHPLDYSVEYYYKGDAPIAMMDLDDAQALASLEAAVRGKRRALLAWPFGSGSGRFPFLLEMNGRLASRKLFKGYSLRVYELERDIFPPTKIEPALANFGDVRLTGAFYQVEAEADNAICLALRWQLARATKRDYKSTVILWDEAGRRLSAADVLLLDERGLSTRHWSSGEEAINYYIVPVPIGTPPLSYEITVGVYDDTTMRGLSFLDAAGNPLGTDFPLGEVKLTRAERFDRDPYETGKAFDFQPIPQTQIAKGLSLEGFHLDGQKVREGEKMGVVLKWRALSGNLPDYIPCLRLRQDGTTIAESENAPADGRYPTGLWGEGEIVLDRRYLLISPQAREGEATLEIEVNKRVRTLAQLEIAHSERIFTVPTMEHELRAQFGDFAELIGYDLDRIEVTVKDKVKLALYWRAINEEPVETSYKVFTHLLDEEGKLIGQHDGFPTGGARPTTSWVDGEIIVDLHEMDFREPYQGKAIIEVGMYDPKTVERLLVFGRDGKRLPNDRVLLEATITVE